MFININRIMIGALITVAYMMINTKPVVCKSIPINGTQPVIFDPKDHLDIMNSISSTAMTIVFILIIVVVLVCCVPFLVCCVVGIAGVAYLWWTNDNTNDNNRRQPYQGNYYRGQPPMDAYGYPYRVQDYQVNPVGQLANGGGNQVASVPLKTEPTTISIVNTAPAAKSTTVVPGNTVTPKNNQVNNIPAAPAGAASGGGGQTNGGANQVKTSPSKPAVKTVVIKAPITSIKSTSSSSSTQSDLSSPKKDVVAATNLTKKVEGSSTVAVSVTQNKSPQGNSPGSPGSKKADAKKAK